jgi:hypothetical protein
VRAIVSRSTATQVKPRAQTLRRKRDRAHALDPVRRRSDLHLHLGHAQRARNAPADLGQPRLDAVGGQ